MLAQENDGGGSLVRRYINGPQGALTMSSGGNLYYLHRDPIGSITDVTNSSGTAQWQTTYEPYGDIKTQSHPGAGPAVPLGFAGQYQDTETSDYQMRARQYDPTIGSFQSLDPAAAPITESYTGSYAYVRGRPTVYTDRTGRCIDPLTGAFYPCLEGPTILPYPTTDPGNTIITDPIPDRDPLGVILVNPGDRDGLSGVSGGCGEIARILVASCISPVPPGLMNSNDCPEHDNPGESAPKDPVTRYPRDPVTGNIIGGTPGGDALSGAEREAIKNYEKGRPFNRKDLKSGRKKLVGQEKFAEERNRQKRKS